ncbi:hypothetical protein SAMN02745823_00593 [Sporobacter termitidis DSM 10068]|uniref:Uncharacterized protein n=1 Tax=Sporobacter termitidis DSM 10068 TaxID=1123282 RepID=A0A1M5UMX1_9FIRM|nr:permease prefix domain 1-containing protein [Sporobacter termitidis]SHH64297.1 hypothetical protein SAMN02745823_00593 [Sporobacter termitidis DSM 10068]
MEAKIRAYVDELFAGTAPSRKSVELKEEMIQNLTEKYNDLISEGKTAEAAYNIAIAGIGDVSDLLKDLERSTVSPEMLTSVRQRSAMFTSIAVMLYIISVIPIIVLSVLFSGGWLPGLIVMFLLIAAATGLLIYNGMTKPKFVKQDTMVEEFKQWQTGSQEQKALRNAIHTALWTITIAIYFIVSFSTGAWHLSWIIFLVTVAIQAIINAAFAFKK